MTAKALRKATFDSMTDCNDDGGTNVADAVYLLNNLFIPGSAPIPAPGTNLDCGPDPTEDDLECDEPTDGC